MRKRNNLNAGNLLLAKSYPPPVQPGPITVHASQRLYSPDSKEAETLSRAGLKEEQIRIACQAPGLTLDKEEVYSVYPPENAYGLFETTLPHMVLRRKTLPWERRMDIPDAPWLALLLFSEKEDVSLESLDVSEAFSERPDTYCPVKQKEGYETGTACMALDVSAELFCRVCPTAEELALLAHARCVNRDHKPAGRTFQEEWVSVLTCSRLPCSGTGDVGFRNTLYLVSLEDFCEFLTDGDLRGLVASQEKWKRVRIPVLAVSSFYSRQEEYGFAKYFRALTADLLRVRQDPKETGAAEPLLQRGYSAHNHLLRDGGRTVSFYHGPLLPWDAPCPEPKYEIFADARLVYQPELGMFDVSQSAAANLGKMLAIQDGVFGKALLDFRKGNRLKAEEHDYRNYGLTGHYGVEPPNDGGMDLKQALDREATALFGGLLERQQAECEGGAGGGSPSPDRRGKNADPRFLCREKTSRFALNQYYGFLSDGVDIPDAITDFLTDLSLLYRVPFSYLAPDERMLPENSIRFFRLDFQWLYALLDGAMTLGRCFQEDYRQDTLLIEQILSRVDERRCTVRPRLLRKDPDSLPGHIRQCLETAGGGVGGQVNTGFLMRSELVKSFRGMEFLAYAKQGGGDPLPCLRLEAIGRDILMGIYAGECNYLEIRQPPEGMHFGMEKADQSYTKLMRDLKTGELFSDKQENRVQISFRDGAAGVVDMKETAETIRKKCHLEQITSAHLALQMIQNPFTGVIETKP